MIQLKTSVIILLLFGFCLTCRAQTRIDTLEQKLEAIADETPGLEETVDFSVQGVSIQEFLRGLAQNNNLNVSVDPTLDIKIYNNFTNEKVKNIILFLCDEYQLDINFRGSIMSFHKYAPPVIEPDPVPRTIKINYTATNGLISMDLKRDTLASVVEKITEITGENVLMAPDVDGEKLVSAYILNKPLKNALDKLAYANALELSETPDSFFVLEKPVEPEKKDGANQRSRTQKKSSSSGSSSRYNKKSENDEFDGEFTLHVKDSLEQQFITFQADKIPIKDAIAAVAMEAEEDYFLFSEPEGSKSIHIKDVLFENFISLILQNTEHTYKKNENIYLIGDRKSESLRTTRVLELKYRSFEDVMPVIPTELASNVEMNEFKELNSIIMSGSTPQIKEIERFIKEIDKTVPLIMIEVILVDIQKGRSIETGIRAGTDTISSGGSLLPQLDFVFSTQSINNALSRAPFNLGRVAPNFYLQLKAMDEQQDVDVRSMPKLSTLNGHEASMRVGQTRYYRLQTQNVVGSVTTNTLVTEQFNSVEANLAIGILPVVSGEDQVTLDIDVEVSDFIGEIQSNEPPPTSTSQFTSMIRVKNEEMILLGGLERKEKSESGESVPLLGRIPVIKWLFSSRSRSRSETISIVFIKPTIIH